MKLHEVREIHKNTGQRYRRIGNEWWLFEVDGMLKMDGPMIPWFQPRDLESEDWEVEPLPKSKKQDEEDLEFLNKLIEVKVLEGTIRDLPILYNIRKFAEIIKRKCFGDNK